MWKRILLGIILIGAQMAAFDNKAHAIVMCGRAELSRISFAKNAKESNIAVIGLADKGGTTFWDLPTLMETGLMVEESEKCKVNIAEDYGYEIDGTSCAITQEECGPLGVHEERETSMNTRLLSIENANGSLLSMAQVMESANRKDPVPLSLAYYYNRNVEKIPFVGTALAADAAELAYAGPFLDVIFDYWTAVRTIAYGFMAIVMLVTGIMVIMRKNIGPQVSVTVQQALPNIVISIILITFSYPIGAAGASLAFNVRGNVASIMALKNVSKSPKAADITAVSVANFIASTQWFTVGIVSNIFGAVASFIATVMGIIVMLKTFTIYFKMLFAIIMSPLSFALGAIPTYQANIGKWFKQYIAYMLAVPAMSLVTALTQDIVVQVGKSTSARFEDLYGGWGFAVLAGLALPAITSFGYSMALSTPQKIEELLGIGEVKKK